MKESLKCETLRMPNDGCSNSSNNQGEIVFFFFINILNIILHSKKYLEMLIIPSEDHLSFLLSFFSARCKSTADHRLLEVSFILQTLCI